MAHHKIPFCARIATAAIVLLASVTVTPARADISELWAEQYLETDMIPAATLKKSSSRPRALRLKFKARELLLPGLNPNVVSFIEDCAELEAVPLLELKKDGRRRVYLGINFDGVFGIHGTLR